MLNCGSIAVNLIFLDMFGPFVTIEVQFAVRHRSLRLQQRAFKRCCAAVRSKVISAAASEAKQSQAKEAGRSPTPGVNLLKKSPYPPAVVMVVLMILIETVALVLII